MKMTLLELTQKILSSMDSDEVNSITDTTEASQVVDVIHAVYNDIFATANLPEHRTVFELQASGNVNLPTIMYLPASVVRLDWVKYDNILTGETENSFKNVDYMDLDDFLHYCLGMTGDNVEAVNLTIGSDTIEFKCYNNVQPQYYTTIDDYTLVFDSYLASEDTTLQKSKTMAYGQVIPTFTRSDDFTPSLDAKQFALLFNEAKAQAWAELKQTENARAERKARKGWISLQKDKYAVAENMTFFNKLPHYGRK